MKGYTYTNPVDGLSHDYSPYPPLDWPRNEYNQMVKSVEMSQRIAKLPVSEKGYPVPYFVSWINGKPEFRAASQERVQHVIHHNLCWVCGEPLGRYKIFAIGSMCAINRTTAEPPTHLECAEYSVKVCPFLSMPKMVRNHKNLPGEAGGGPGTMLERNPGVVAVWITDSWTIRHRDQRGILFKVGDPSKVKWYCEGRAATYAEVIESIRTGLPSLLIEAEKDGPQAMVELKYLIASATRYFPAPEQGQIQTQLWVDTPATIGA